MHSNQTIEYLNSRLEANVSHSSPAENTRWLSGIGGTSQFFQWASHRHSAGTHLDYDYPDESGTAAHILDISSHGLGKVIVRVYRGQNYGYSQFKMDLTPSQNLSRKRHLWGIALATRISSTWRQTTCSGVELNKRRVHSTLLLLIGCRLDFHSCSFVTRRRRFCL